MAVCTYCSADLVDKNGELFDADGEPHKPNCPAQTAGSRASKTVGKHHCKYCGKETNQETTVKRGRENRRCLKCFRGGEVRAGGRR